MVITITHLDLKLLEFVTGVIFLIFLGILYSSANTFKYVGEERTNR